MSASTPSWSDLLLGTEPRLRNRSLLTLLGSLVYVVWLLALVLFAMPQQRVSPELGRVLMVLMVPGILLFAVLMRREPPAPKSALPA